MSAYVGLGMGLAQGDGPRKKKRRTTKEYVKRIVDEYEAKIAGIVRSLLTRLSPADQELWDEAVRKLREGDHYLLVFIDAGSPATGASLPGGLRAWFPDDRNSPRPRGDLRRLILVALVLFMLFFVVMLLFSGNARR